MKRVDKQILAVVFSALLLLSLKPAMAQPNGRFEAEMGGGLFHLPTPYRAGWVVRQQLMGYVAPRVGVSIGLNWAASANLDPLLTLNPNSSPGSPVQKPDPARLLELYHRQDRMADLSVVVLPIKTNRHQLNLQLGLSAYRHREIGVDSIVYPGLFRDYYEEVPRIVNTRRVVPRVGVSYTYRLSERWGIGLSGSAYASGNRLTARPTTTLSLSGVYRFRLRADSLGILPVQWTELKAGFRGGINVSANNGKGITERYRSRINAGLWAELPLSLTWGLRGELNYAQRGYRALELVRGNTRYLPAIGNLNYLETALLFRNEVTYRWHLYAGPYLAFFLNGRTETDYAPDEPVEPHTTSGLMLGSSYNLTNRLAVDLRYQRDLLQISSNPYGGMHGFQLALSYQFSK